MVLGNSRVWLGICACVCLAAASGNAQKITVRFENHTDSVVVRVKGDSPFTHTLSLVGPGSSVNLDLRAHLVGSYRTIRVASGGVSRMWVGWYQAKPPITRLRIVTTERRPYRVERTDDGCGLTVTVDKRLQADPTERLAVPNEDTAAAEGQATRIASPVAAPVSTAPVIEAPDRPVAPIKSVGKRYERTSPGRRPATVRAIDEKHTRPTRADHDTAPVTTVEPAPVKPEGGASPATPAAPPVTTPPVVPQSKVSPDPVAAGRPQMAGVADAGNPQVGGTPISPDEPPQSTANIESHQTKASMVPIGETRSSSLPELIWAATGLFGIAVLYSWGRRIRQPRRLKPSASEAMLTYKRPAAAVITPTASTEKAVRASQHTAQNQATIAPDDVKRLEQTVEQLILRLDQKAEEVIARIERERAGIQCERTNTPRPDRDADGTGRDAGRSEAAAPPKPLSRGMRELLAELDRIQEETAPDA